MLPCIIDATEGWDVATDGILWAFLQTDYYKGDIHLNMEEAVVNLSEEIDPIYC